jgi:hypothetical protein
MGDGERQKVDGCRPRSDGETQRVDGSDESDGDVQRIDGDGKVDGGYVSTHGEGEGSAGMDEGCSVPRYLYDDMPVGVSPRSVLSHWACSVCVHVYVCMCMYGCISSLHLPN